MSGEAARLQDNPTSAVARAASKANSRSAPRNVAKAEGNRARETLLRTSATNRANAMNVGLAAQVSGIRGRIEISRANAIKAGTEISLRSSSRNSATSPPRIPSPARTISKANDLSPSRNGHAPGSSSLRLKPSPVVPISRQLGPAIQTSLNNPNRGRQAILGGLNRSGQ